MTTLDTPTSGALELTPHPSNTAQRKPGFFSRLRGVRTDGYAPVPVPAAASAATQDEDPSRPSTDGELLDRFPALDMEGTSVVVSSEAEWVNDSEQLLNFVQGEVPIMPPEFGLRVAVHRPIVAAAPSQPWETQRQRHRTSVQTFSPDTEIYAFTIPIAAAMQMPVLEGRGLRQRSNRSAVARAQASPVSTVCAVNELVPCYRNAVFLGDSGLTYDRRPGAGQRMLPPDAKATIRVRVPSGHSNAGAMATLRAPRPLRATWNRQSLRGLRPPWAAVPLMRGQVQAETSLSGPDTGGAEAVPEAEQDPDEVKVGLRRALNDFVRAPTRTAKVLRAEHVVYGWDLDQLRDQLQGELDASRQLARGRTWMEEAALEASGRGSAAHDDDDDPEAHAGGGEYVQVSYAPLPVWFDLQVRASFSRFPLSLLAPLAHALHPLPTQLAPLPSAGRRWPFAAAVMSPVFLFAGLTFSSSLDEAAQASVDTNRILAHVCFWLAALLAALAVSAFAALSYISTSDTIVLAHPLTAYQATGIAADVEQHDVATQLARQHLQAEHLFEAEGKRPAVHYVLEEDEEVEREFLRSGGQAVTALAEELSPRLVLSPGHGWLLRHGIDQDVWMKAHRLFFADAFRYRWQGDVRDKLEEYRTGSQ